EIRDRGSTFVASIYHSKAPEEPGGGPDDFELKSGNDDDGEKWASIRVMKIMEAQAVIDAVVVVSRWELANLTAAESSDKPSEHSVRTSTKTPDYSTFTDSDLPKAKRLVLARERAVTSVKNMIAKRRAAIEIT
ncbi:hypothetical protein MPER_11059, partial [Moniliophthora perniciosa FA553]